ncbi:MAG: carboxypeptidase-like regulatory domain-containing protein [Vicinamibacterales bacterium]
MKQVLKQTFTVAMLTAAMVVAGTTVGLAQNRGIGRINGVVVSEAGDPLDGVVVKAPTSGGDALQGNSNDQGKWAIGGIGKGEWVVQFDKAGYEPKRVKVVVQKESLNPEVIKIVLKRAS